MSNARTAFCLMWILPPLEGMILYVLVIPYPNWTLERNTVAFIGFAAICLTVIWLLRMADPSTRRKKKIVSPVETKIDMIDRKSRYILGDDGEIMEVIDDEKRKRGEESTVE